MSTASVQLAPAERPALGLSRDEQQNNTSADFVVPPSGGVFMIGNNAVIFPARSICDPATSGYGPDTWDRSCRSAKMAIKVHAEIRTAKLGTWIDFSPALRFVPTGNPARYVWLYMHNSNVSAASDLSKFTINYSSGFGDLGFDESIFDASLRTYVDQAGAMTLRRIKHFSTYNTSSGKSCDPAVETDCYPSDGGGGGIGGP